MFFRKSISLLVLVCIFLSDLVAAAPSAPVLADAAHTSGIESFGVPLAPEAVNRITLTEAGFDPPVLTVTVDTEVSWINATAQTHILQSGEPAELYLPLVVHAVGSGEQSLAPPVQSEVAKETAGKNFRATIQPGGVFTYTFTTVGEVPYFLADAPHRKGRIVVTYNLDAPPLDPTVATTLCKATAFLYTGSDPLQTGVAPGTIDCQHAAVLRGRVLGWDGAPLAGVEVAILDHPEYGQTLSREDGWFDLAVNGGAFLTLNYHRDGYLLVQRPIDVPWNDYAHLPDVVLISVDPQVTRVDLTQKSEPFSLAQGSKVTDGDGTRQETLLIPQGTAAELVLPGGVTQTLTSLNVHLTEFTVGDSGPQAMPGPLPSNVGYTYAFELNADEELAAGAEGVVFSQPLIHYVDNFLDFPAGTTVPLGTYDPSRGVWAPEESGLVLKILSITGGLADLDIDGDELADDPSELAPWGITDGERAEMAQIYPAGTSLWRVLVSHFSEPWDCNWALRCKDDQCESPNGPSPDAPPPPVNCTGEGSIIGCQTQTLGENIGLTGTLFELHYESSRTPGWKVAYTLNIPLSGATVLPGLKRIDLEIYVAGRVFRESFPAQAGLKTEFTWDGKDAYGRTVQGRQPIAVWIGFVYEAEYIPTDLFGSGAVSSNAITGDLARKEITLWRDWQGLIGSWDATTQGLGGWNLDVHHTYEPQARLLYLGDGTVRAASNTASVIDIVAGCEVESGECSLGVGDGYPAARAILKWPEDVVAAPDGSIYFSDTDHHRIRRVGADGILTTVAGNGSPGFSGDGGPATAASLYNPKGIALAPDGSLYIADYSNGRVRRVGPDGTITTVAGGGALEIDGVPATQVSLLNVYDVAFSPDGRLYLTRGQKVRRVDPDGLIWTAAGTTVGYSGDGGLAVSARLNGPKGIALAPDGSLYIADTGNHCVRRVGNDGIITTVAGDGTPGYIGDGRPATQAQLRYPKDVALAPDGGLYIADDQNHSVRYVDLTGIITTVAGGRYPLQSCSGPRGEGGPATAACFMEVSGVDVAPDGTLYIADRFYGFIHHVHSALPGFSAADIAIPSEDGEELYQFSATGRHLRTLNALTGAALLEFGYDSTGLLTTLTDGDGNMTTIERDSGGDPLGILGPYGQRTALSVDDAGCLADVTNPASEAYRFEYQAGCLLTGLTDPRLNQSRYSYDGLGRLTKARDRAGNLKTLTRTETRYGYQVAVTTAMGYTTTYLVEQLPTGGILQVNTFPNGLSNQLLYSRGASQVITYTNGTVVEVVSGPDPRWGMLAPVNKVITFTLPSGLASVIQTSRTAVLSDPANPMSLETLDEVVNLNDRDYLSRYDAASRTFTFTSPAGRQIVLDTDLLGRPLNTQTDGLEPTEFRYDSHGRLNFVIEGTGMDARTTTLAYNSEGSLESVVDPLDRIQTFTYDLAGRITEQTLPGSRVITYTYDANSNLASLAPPGKPAHEFTYTPVDLTSSYIPPDVGQGDPSTEYAYNLDGQLTLITRPDDRIVELDYDKAGRLSVLATSPHKSTYTYDVTTGDLMAIENSLGVDLSYTYDGGVLTGTTWSGSVSGEITGTYDDNLRLIELAIPGDSSISLQYDDDSLLTKAGDLILDRDLENGLLTGSTLDNFTDHWGYSSFGEPASYAASYNGVNLFSVQFGRDKLGRITQKTETTNGKTAVYRYTYDLAGRLSGVKKDGITIATYTYDDNGNRLTYTGPGGTIAGSYDDQDRLLSYGGTTYAYTANGELLSKTTGGQVTNYAYDALGNLLSVDLPDGTQIDYLIDGANHRLGKKVNGVLVQGFLYEDTLRPAAELDGAGNLVSRFVYGTRVNVPEFMLKGGNTYRFVLDHLGSPRLVVNVGTGQVAQRMDYDEFGNVINDTNPGFQPFGFAGGLYDPQTGLVRFGWRDYDSRTGRWTAQDPIGFWGGSPNLYEYVAGDPINGQDPYGTNIFGEIWDWVCNPRTWRKDFLPFFFDWAQGEGGASPYDPSDALKKGEETIKKHAEQGGSWQNRPDDDPLKKDMIQQRGYTMP